MPTLRALISHRIRHIYYHSPYSISVYLGARWQFISMNCFELAAVDPNYQIHHILLVLIQNLYAP